MLNAMKLQAAMQQTEQAQSRMCIVSGYNPANYCAKVRLLPEDVETGWLPVLSPWVGNGWGFFAPPTPGDLVDVQFTDGDFTQGIVCQRFFNDAARPLNVPAGEFWLQHKSGAFFKLTNDGKASFSDGHGATVTLNGDGTISSVASAWTHTGPVTVTGKITGQGGMAISGGTGATVAGNVAVTGGNVTADGIGLKTHTHTDPQGGTVGLPQ